LAYIEQAFRTEIEDYATRKALDDIAAVMREWQSAEHGPNGRHEDITAKSLIVTGPTLTIGHLTVTDNLRVSPRSIKILTSVRLTGNVELTYAPTLDAAEGLPHQVIEIESATLGAGIVGIQTPLAASAEVLWLVNKSNQSVKLINGSAAASNVRYRIVCPQAVDWLLQPYTAVMLYWTPNTPSYGASWFVFQQPDSGDPGPIGPAGPPGTLPTIAASRLLGRGSASGTGQAEEIFLGTGLTMVGRTLEAAGGGGGGGDLEYLGGYVPATYNDGDIVVAADGIAYMCVKDGTTTAPEPWPGMGISTVVGPPGPAGPQGNPGPAGPQGIPGPTGGPPIGSIMMWGGATAPNEWVLCDGGVLPRSTYAALFAVIGTTYGAGDGTTTFNVPNMAQRFPLGKSAAGTGAVLGSVGGQIDHTHAIPSHSHAAGSLAVASHSHDAGTLAVASHSHSSGSFAVASHTHAPGTLANSTVANHQHTLGSHTHAAGSYKTVATIGGSISGTTGTYSHDAFNYSAGSLQMRGFYSPMSHAHSFSANLSLPFDADLSGTSGAASGNTGSDGGHTHTLSGATAAATPSVTGTSGSATPDVTGTTGATAPALTGAVAADPGMTTDAKNPPYLTVNYIIRAL